MIRRALVHTHRWLGIAGGLLFAMWFATGIVMMYAGMPTLTAAERRATLPSLDASGLRVGPEEAARLLDTSPLDLRLGMLGDRPIYRVDPPSTPSAVFADDGQRLDELAAAGALDIAAAFDPRGIGSLAYQDLLRAPDQWTLELRLLLPMHRLSVGDPEDTRLYVSDRTGEVVLRTTRASRRWAYMGAVLHWLYFTPFRAHSALWAQTIIWLSVLGCVLTLSGLVWGLLRFSPTRRYGRRGRPSASPYTGLVRWHHYAGLAFGLFTFTWILSGGLSMDPWSWHPETTATRAQAEAAAGGPVDFGRVSPDLLRDAVEVLAGRMSVREVGFVQFRGELFLLGYGGADGRGALLSALRAGAEAFSRFDRPSILAAARNAMPGVPIRSATWLDSYDSYYYDGAGAGPLPVLRVEYGDPRRTWLYLDPGRGAIVRKEERLTRLNRWLYHGLHSLDFPFLQRHPSLRAGLVIVLSLGGLLVSASTLAPGWKRVLRR